MKPLNTARIRTVLKQERLKKGLSAQALADRVGVSKTTIYRYENGDIKKMPMQVLTKLAQQLNISPEFIAGYQADPHPVDHTDPVHQITMIAARLTHERQQRVANFAKEQLSQQVQVNEKQLIPFKDTSRRTTKPRQIITGRSTAAGLPINGDDQDVKAVIEMVSDQQQIPAGANEVVTVDGDSMEPDFPKHSSIFIHYQKKIKDNDFVLLHIRDEGVIFKQLKIDRQRKKLILHSLNPNYADRAISEDDVNIIGVAIPQDHH